MSYRSDLVYQYDGSFDGLLCCIHESYYQKELPLLIFTHDKTQETLFPVKEIITDHFNAERVEDSISSKISKEALRLVRLCYFSNEENKEIIILNFLRLGYKLGAKVTNMLSNDTVNALIKCSRLVSREGMYFKEFIRFSDYNGALVAIIEPKNFVLPLIVNHFCDRYPSEQFLIYDETNKHTIIYQNFEADIVPLELLELPKACEKEKKYRELWKQFYNTIAIESRINLKLRMGNMPKRYWKNLTEFQD